MMTLPISGDNIHEELSHVEKIVTTWRMSVDKGIVGVDTPAPDAEEKLELYLRQLTGELLFAAGKLQNLAVLLSER